MIRVSIIILVCNQTYTPIECLLIDEASPDNSIALAKQRLESYSGTIDSRFIFHEKNEGASVVWKINCKHL
jgi:glycosyltransferase involved in cell wall biosynthesis